MSTPLQGYQRNEEALADEKARLEREANTYGNTAPILRLNTGATWVRILPSYSAEGLFFKKQIRHYVGFKGDAPFIGLCPAETTGDDCAICDKGAELYATKDETALKLAKDLKPQVRYIYNALCLRGPADKKGNAPEFGKVYVLEAGLMVHRQIFSLDQDPAVGWDDITNLETGVTLIIKKEGALLETKYTVMTPPEGRTNIYEKLQAQGIDPTELTLYDLDKVNTVPPANELEKVAKKIRVPAMHTTPPTFAPAPAPTPAAVSEASQGTQPVPQAPAPSSTPVPAPVIPAPPVPGE